MRYNGFETKIKLVFCISVLKCGVLEDERSIIHTACIVQCEALGG